MINWKTLASGILLAIGHALKGHAPNTVWWHVGDILIMVAPVLLGVAAADAKPTNLKP